MKTIISLIRPVISPNEFSGIPNELLILGAALKEKRYQSVIKDFDFLKEINFKWKNKKDWAKRAALEILNTNCQYIGITSMCSNYVLAIELAKEIKTLNSDIHITLGGPQATMCAKETLQIYPEIDSIVIGEGEVTYPELIKSLDTGKTLKNILGVAYRDKNSKIKINDKRPLLEDLDNSPLPLYDLINIPEYLDIKDKISIYVGTGCPYNCNFCTTSLFWERNYRVKPIDRIIKEIDFLYRKYGVKNFDFIHDNLSANKDFLNNLAKSIKKQEWDIKYEFSSRVDALDEETIKNVAESGCNQIFFGIESGSKRIQEHIGKKLTINKIKDTIQTCLKYGISPVTSFIIGFPEERVEELEKTIRLAFRCKIATGQLVIVNLLSIYTGSKLFEENFNQLAFEENNLNPFMTYFLNDYHIKDIAKYPYIYPNYYFLNYDDSCLNTKEYLLLLDFLTVTIEKYSYVINIIINDLEISPISLFKFFVKKIAKQAREKLDNLQFNINKNEILNFARLLKLSKKETNYVLDGHRYDTILNKLFNSAKNKIKISEKCFINLKNWRLYKSKLNLFDNDNFMNKKLISDKVFYYIIYKLQDNLLTGLLEKEQYKFLSRLYEKDIIKFKEIGMNEDKIDLIQFIETCCDVGIFKRND